MANRENQWCGVIQVKKNKIGKKWKKMFVVVDERSGEVQIFKNDQEFTPRKHFNLADVHETQSIVAHKANEKKKRYSFIVHKNVAKSIKKYTFATETDEERTVWIAKMKSVITNLKQAQQKQDWISKVQLRTQAFEEKLEETTKMLISLSIDYESFPWTETTFQFFMEGEILHFLVKTLRDVYSATSKNTYRVVKAIVLRQKNNETQKTYFDNFGVLQLVIDMSNTEHAAYISDAELRQLLDKQNHSIMHQIMEDCNAYTESLQTIRSILGANFTNLHITIEWGQRLMNDSVITDEDFEAQVQDQSAYATYIESALLPAVKHVAEQLQGIMKHTVGASFLAILKSIALCIDQQTFMGNKPPHLRIQSNTDIGDIFFNVYSALSLDNICERVYEIVISMTTAKITRMIEAHEAELHKNLVDKNISLEVSWSRITSACTNNQELMHVMDFLVASIDERLASFITAVNEYHVIAQYVGRYVVALSTVDSCSQTINNGVLYDFIVRQGDNPTFMYFVPNLTDMLRDWLHLPAPASILTVSTAQVTEETRKIIASAIKLSHANLVDHDIDIAIHKAISQLQKICMLDGNDMLKADQVEAIASQYGERIQLAIAKQVYGELEAKELVAFDEFARVILTFALPLVIKENIDNRRDVMLFGLPNAGKTTLVSRLKTGQVQQTSPSIGFTKDNVPHKTFNLFIHEIGGNAMKRASWKLYLQESCKLENVHGLVFVIDGTQFAENADVIKRKVKKFAKFFYKFNRKKLLKDPTSPTTLSNVETSSDTNNSPEFGKLPLLILVNKADTKQAISEKDFAELFNEFLEQKLIKYVGACKIQFCSASNGTGITTSMEWLSINM